MLTHFLFEGNWRHPVRRWSVDAPLYYVADSTFTRVVACLCGAACATAWRAVA